MQKLFFSLSLAVLAFTSVAHADTFNFYGTTQSGSIGTGTITTDAGGSPAEAQITFTGGNTQGTYTFSSYFPTAKSVDLGNQTGNVFRLFLQTPLAGVSSDGVCIANCTSSKEYSYISSQTSFERFLSGTLTLQTAPPTVAAAATPEPSSLILLGTGILGMAGAARRKFLLRA